MTSVTSTKRRVVVSDAVIHPGELLAEELDVRGMTQRELALAMGRPPQLISEIVRGRRGISAETALQLEAALGTAAHIWIGLDADYRLALALQRSRARVAVG